VSWRYAQQVYGGAQVVGRWHIDHEV
jgi:hypothetical protein